MSITIVEVPSPHAIAKEVFDKATPEEWKIPEGDYAGDQFTQAADKVTKALLDKYVTLEMTQYHYHDLVVTLRTLVIETQ